MKTRMHVRSAVLGLLGLFAALYPYQASAQTTEYYHLDAVGNVRAVTNQSGTVIERHDYLPFGEECTTGPCLTSPGVGGGLPTKFTGKERDSETGLDYFGARYYGSNDGRFTTVDPVLAVNAALADPQRWNRYAYGRSNPLRYFDPTGAVLEVTGNDRDEAFALIQDTVGERGASLLHTRTDDGRTFVEYSGGASDSLAATGINGVILANIIDSAKTTEFSLVNGDYLLRKRFQSVALATKGGAATIGSEESLNGNTQVFVGRSSADYLNFYSMSPLGSLMSNDPSHPLQFSLALIAAHELGHAESNVMGAPINSIVSDHMALFAENAYRAAHGDRYRRVRH